jgi:hypothetical protein
MERNGKPVSLGRTRVTAGRAGALPIVGVLTALAIWPVNLCAAPQGGGAPSIDIRAAPSKTMPGGHVTLTGNAVPMGQENQAAIVVQPPGGGESTLLQAPVEKEGQYLAIFKLEQNAALGTYKVQVTAPDGKSTASTTVIVAAAGVIPAEVMATTRSLLESVQEAAQVVRKAFADLPPSPGLQEADARLAEAEGRTSEALMEMPAAQQEMAKVFQARGEVEEDNPEWDTYVAEIESWEIDAKDRTEELRATIKGISGGTERCGTMDEIVEGLTLASEAANYANTPLDKSVGYWIDKVPGGFVARQNAWSGYKPATKFLAISTMKTAANFLKEGPIGVIQSIPGLVADAAQLVAQEVMGAYCERIEGPISATFIGESFTNQGEPFFDYTTTLDGKIVFLYEKDAQAGQPIGLLGYIEGNGRFEVRDNPEPVIRLTPGDVLFHKVVSPPGSGYWDEVGQFSRALLPHSFKIPLKGVLAGDSIVFALEPATHDFGEAIQGRSIYVVMPLGGLVPQIIDSPIPLQKAFPMIERVVRGYPVLKVTRGGKETVVQGTFARDTTNANHTARVRTQLTMKACSPGCLPLPYTPSGKNPGGKTEDGR